MLSNSEKTLLNSTTKRVPPHRYIHHLCTAECSFNALYIREKGYQVNFEPSYTLNSQIKVVVSLLIYCFFKILITWKGIKGICLMKIGKRKNK